MNEQETSSWSPMLAATVLGAAVSLGAASWPASSPAASAAAAPPAQERSVSSEVLPACRSAKAHRELSAVRTGEGSRRLRSSGLADRPLEFRLEEDYDVILPLNDAAASSLDPQGTCS